ncbi:DUF4136 domain-containing protein [Shewanella marinintestina]|uniref:DUF4136 domain-containing protein n=1 Tax=Shewanella marinintestina TaxID=190305 RepID=UPI00200D2F88|nr:DUF4136 domain-containing protein [Shewanella marinintestina]MCL1147932.1 DUF4136 domain-containing protein [Shewanella marinintestina]
MMNKYISIVVLGLSLLTACSSTDSAERASATRTTMVISGDLSLINSHSKAFSWHPTMFAVHANDTVDSEMVIQHMQKAITNVMQKKGYHLANQNETPSVLVGYGLALESEMSDKEILKKAGLVAGLSTAGVDDKYEKGSVLVALFNPMSPMPVWRVLAQGFTELDKTTEQREQRFEELLSSMLKPVPVH